MSVKDINWTLKPADKKLMLKIVERGLALCAKHGGDYEEQDMRMDLTACHLNGMPLDLKKLLEADDFNFAHDVFGIRKHINRRTGKVERMFLPRCAMPEGKVRNG